MNNTVVLGGGSWGTALAHLLASTGQQVDLLLRDANLAAHINQHHENPRYLPGKPLHPLVRAHATPVAEASCLRQAALVILAVPCQALRATLRELDGVLAPCVLVNTAKGIEVSGLVTPLSIVQDELPRLVPTYAVLSGPSFSREVVENKPTAVVLGCRDEALGARLRTVFSTDWFRAYSCTDVVGVELGGAIKNVIAIGAGISDGLGFGLNARASLVTRGLVEIRRLGEALGASPETFMGLSGLGDLMLTCSGDLSRNRQVGLRLGQGEALTSILASMYAVAEGVKTTEAVWSLATRHHVDMPVTRAMYQILYDGFAPRAAVQALMRRQLREE